MSILDSRNSVLVSGLEPKHVHFLFFSTLNNQSNKNIYSIKMQVVRKCVNDVSVQIIFFENFGTHVS